jgi:hypothetical protein
MHTGEVREYGYVAAVRSGSASTTPYRLYIDFAVHRDYSSPAARALRRPRRASRLLVSGRTRSTSTSPCAATTRLRPHALYVHLAMRCDYSSPAARALRQPRCPPRVLVFTLPAAAIYLDSAARPSASARRAACHAARPRPLCLALARRRLLRLAQAHRRLLRLRCASGCLGTSRGSSRGSWHRSSSTTPSHAGSSSTTPPRAGSSSTTPPRIRVPRHVARLVIDYFASATRPGASARRAARHVASRAARRRLLRVAQSRRRLLRAPRLCLAATLALLQPRHASRLLVPTSSTPHAVTTSSSGHIALTIHLD